MRRRSLGRPTSCVFVLALLWLGVGITGSVLAQWAAPPDIHVQHAAQSPVAVAKSTLRSKVAVVCPQSEPPPPATEEEEGEEVHVEPIAPHFGTYVPSPPLNPPVQMAAREISGPEKPAAPTDFSIFIETQLQVAASGYAPEPSVAVNDQIVFTTYNRGATLSTNAGMTSQYVDPWQFPPAGGGFCCDQVAIYEPTRHILVWLLQYFNQPGSGNILRLAVATGAQAQEMGTWHYWDITPASVGLAPAYWFDFSDLAFDGSQLFLSTNYVYNGDGSYSGSKLLTMPLDVLASGGDLPFWYVTDPNTFAFKLAQGTNNPMWALSTTYNGYVFCRRLYDDGGFSDAWAPVPTWTDWAHACTDPNGVNWCGFKDSRMSAAWFAEGRVCAMWDGAQGGPFPYPFSQYALIDPVSGFSIGGQFWNPDYAWQYGSAGPNGRGDTAAVLYVGGPANYVTAAAFLRDDVSGHGWEGGYLLDTGTGSPVDGNGNPINRWGDYFTIRPHNVFNNSWNLVTAVPTGGPISPKWFWLGRERDLPTWPTNDSCFSALDLSLTEDSPVTVNDDSAYAFDATGDVNDCVLIDRTLWYTFTAPGYDYLSIDSCMTLDSGQYVPIVSVWESGPCPVGYGVVCRGGGPCEGITVYGLPLGAGRQYTIQIGSNSSSIPGLGGPRSTVFSLSSIPPLAIFDITPSTGSPMGGDAILIRGRDFEPGATVRVGGQPATNVFVLSPTQISATTPPGDPTFPANVDVQNSNGRSGRLTAGFFYSSWPVSISRTNPGFGPPSGGVEVTVQGTGFQPGAQASIGGVPASDVVVASDRVLTLTSPALPPGTFNAVEVDNPDSSNNIGGVFIAEFADVPSSNPFDSWIVSLFRWGITGGCGEGNYCPNQSVTRAQMAVFLLKAALSRDFKPPQETGAVFQDVPSGSFAADFIEDLSGRGITGGCGGGNYCPANPVSRAQMAVFLLKSEHGSSYVPPACTGIFSDVACPSNFAPWIEQLYHEGITGGCHSNPLAYCPGSPVTRGQMAVFIVKTFNLPREGDTYFLRLYNIDDVFRAYLTNSQVTNSLILEGQYNQDTGFVDITGSLASGQNEIDLVLTNSVPGTGWTYGFQLFKNGQLLDEGSCGVVGQSGCNGDTTQGDVFQHSIVLDIS